MDVTPGSPAFLLLLTGAFGVSVGNTVARRDGPSALAMAVGFVATAHLAGLPAWLLAWGCLIVAIAVAMSLAGLLLRSLTGGDAFRVGMISTVTFASALVVHHERPLAATTAELGDRSIAFGGELHFQIGALVRG